MNKGDARNALARAVFL
ncbi:TPA: hypothetical protein ACI4FU_005329, partial [Klebsiella pneumoniae]